MLQINKYSNVKLVTVTRQDIPAGQVLAQTTHSVAEFAYEHFEIFKQWKQESNSVVNLAIKDEASLIQLYEKYKQITPHIVAFCEPDIQNQMTSICLYGTPEIRKKLSNLPLALREKKNNLILTN